MPANAAAYDSIDSPFKVKVYQDGDVVNDIRRSFVNICEQVSFNDADSASSTVRSNDADTHGQMPNVHSPGSDESAPAPSSSFCVEQYSYTSNPANASDVTLKQSVNISHNRSTDEDTYAKSLDDNNTAECEANEISSVERSVVSCCDDGWASPGLVDADCDVSGDGGGGGYRTPSMASDAGSTGLSTSMGELDEVSLREISRHYSLMLDSHESRHQPGMFKPPTNILVTHVLAIDLSQPYLNYVM